jgi:hypothetical protein
MDETPEDSVGPADAFHWCKTFRRLSRRTKGLAPTTPEEASEQAERGTILEDLFAILNEVDVWSAEICESICICGVLLYACKDAEAAELLKHLADEELRRMQGKVVEDPADPEESPQEPEDEEEGGGDSG